MVDLPLLPPEYFDGGKDITTGDRYRQEPVLAELLNEERLAIMSLGPAEWDSPIYVDQTNLDPDPNGSHDNPFLTITDALDAIGQPIDTADADAWRTVIIRRGTYVENVVCPPARRIMLAFDPGTIVDGDAEITVDSSAVPYVDYRASYAFVNAAKFLRGISIDPGGYVEITGDVRYVVISAVASAPCVEVDGVELDGAIECLTPPHTTTYGNLVVFNSLIAGKDYSGTWKSINADDLRLGSYFSDFFSLIDVGEIIQVCDCGLWDGIKVYNSVISWTTTGPSGFSRCNIWGGIVDASTRVISTDLFTRNQIYWSMREGYLTLTNPACFFDGDSWVFYEPDFDAGTHVVDSFPTTLANGVTWEMLVYDGASLRTSRISATWRASTATLHYVPETITGETGPGGGITFAIDLVTDTVRLMATATSDNWRVHFRRHLLPQGI